MHTHGGRGSDIGKRVSVTYVVEVLGRGPTLRNQIEES